MSEEAMQEASAEAPVEQIIVAAEMELNQLYLTYQSKARYFISLIKLETMKSEAAVKAYYPNHAEWRTVHIPFEYKLKVLSKEEQQAAYEAISKATKDTRAQFAKINNRAPKAAGKGRDRGALSGLGMLECWGKYFAKFAHQPNMREEIRQAMKEEFPNKHESVDKWLDAYRGYYNKGRLPGAEKPAIEISTQEWKTNDVQAN